ncbi:unnamed protein product [Ilex paraguariensis]|uniref:Uncharacterized protein n=1 Tax=Ilex paraguariensis TaxID=185542 RepID=A0ABC8U123_9AQUA
MPEVSDLIPGGLKSSEEVEYSRRRNAILPRLEAQMIPEINHILCESQCLNRKNLCYSNFFSSLQNGKYQT